MSIDHDFEPQVRKSYYRLGKNYSEYPKKLGHFSCGPY